MPQQDDLVERNEILHLLGPVKRSGEWLMAYCPVHADGSKHNGKGGESLGLSDTGVLRCFAGCSFQEVITALRGNDNRPTPIRIIDKPSERLVKIYKYVDIDGVVQAEKGRFETADKRKTFRWRLPGVVGWPGGINLSEMPLYGAERLKEAAGVPVYYVEGEKACEACWGAGLTAVTHGGGASTKDFGSSLSVLRSRLVYLWPDNDAPGAAYMTLVQAKLTGLAADVRYVSVPIALGPKSDAFDYFEAGGTVEQLSAASPYEPVITILAEDAVRIATPTAAGLVTFEFSEMDKGTRELDTHLVISCQSSAETYSERLNIDSSTARTQLRRDLETFYGKEHGWTGLLNKAVTRARDAYLGQERSEDLFDMPEPMGETLLIPPFLVADGATVLFGDGSSGKSYIALAMALCSAYGIEFCGYRTPELRVLYVDYEDSGPNLKRRAERLGRALGLPAVGVYYFGARGIPLKDQWEAIKRSCDRNGIGWIIVDSAAPACGGPPEDAVAALAFFRALKRIGLPALVIAHITKSGVENTQKPFGSIFWHNEPRRTWYVKRIQEEDSDVIDIGLYCRKVNDGTKPLPVGLHLTFEGTGGPVIFEPMSLSATPELLSETSVRNQIWEALSRPLTIGQLVEDTSIAYKTLERALKDGPFIVTGQTQPSTGKPANLWSRQSNR